MPRYGMVIDLHNCVGCGACALACKTENNTGDRMDGQSFNWADFMFEEQGSYPDMRYSTIPVLCNHCSKAACVEACPTEPKAMYKSPDGLTLHNDERCIGCRACQEACPYSAFDLDNLDESEAGATYSVISYNEAAGACYRKSTQKTAVIKGGTATGPEMDQRVGATPAWRTDYSDPDYGNVRGAEITEKCTFCHHRLTQGQEPACVDACPAGARLFGDMADSGSAPARAIRKHKPRRLKETAGTEPAVYYVRSFHG